MPNPTPAQRRDEQDEMAALLIQSRMIELEQAVVAAQVRGLYVSVNCNNQSYHRFGLVDVRREFKTGKAKTVLKVDVPLRGVKS